MLECITKIGGILGVFRVENNIIMIFVMQYKSEEISSILIVLPQSSSPLRCHARNAVPTRFLSYCIHRILGIGHKAVHLQRV